MTIEEKIVELQEKLGVVTQEIQKIEASIAQETNIKAQFLQEALRVDGALRELRELSEDEAPKKETKTEEQ